MLLDTILEHNRAFVRGREAQPLADLVTIRAAFVACYDPRLDPLLKPALGLEPASGFLFRSAGAIVLPDGDPVRSLALAVYLFGVTEIYVVAHTSCRMATFSSAAFIDAFRARGVPRDAFGAQDLREWTGAFTDTRRRVDESLRALAAAGVFPADLVAGGLLLDDTTGALEVLAHPVSIATLRSGVGATTAPASPGPVEAPTEVALTVAARDAEAERAESPASEGPPHELAREIEAVRGFVEALEATTGWREELARLRAEMDRERGVAPRLALAEKFLRRSAVNARGVAVAFEHLKRETASAARRIDPDELVGLFRRARKKS